MEKKLNNIQKIRQEMEDRISYLSNKILTHEDGRDFVESKDELEYFLDIIPEQEDMRQLDDKYVMAFGLFLAGNYETTNKENQWKECNSDDTIYTTQELYELFKQDNNG